MSEIKTISTARLMGEESRTNKYGTDLWGFFIEFDDGSKGVANGASKTPKWAESGKVVEATDTGYKTPKGHVKWSISIPKDIPLPDNDGFKGTGREIARNLSPTMLTPYQSHGSTPSSPQPSFRNQSVDPPVHSYNSTKKPSSSCASGIDRRD